MVEHQSAIEREDKDLGLGAILTEGRSRLVERDGRFTVERVGRGFRAFLSLYHALLTMTWPMFLGLTGLSYLAFNTAFAFGFVACGENAISGEIDFTPFGKAFFLSVQTSSTVGYGHLAPHSLPAHVLTTIEAFCALLGLALVTGLVFARFSRPMADIVFSDNALIAPYRGGKGLMMRLANRRRNHIVDLEARVILTMVSLRNGKEVREFHDLEMERRKVSFLALSWTLVHPIDEESPLAGVAADEFRKRGGEIIVLLQGMDETFSQVVHTRTSYVADELRWNERFLPVFERSPKGPVRIHLGLLSESEAV
jgi:inward rectifier potassium channel